MSYVEPDLSAEVKGKLNAEQEQVIQQRITQAEQSIAKCDGQIEFANTLLAQWTARKEEEKKILLELKKIVPDTETVKEA
ncbi:MAG: hypothetical protein WC554_18045 [Clostridia bacterium]|jgi:hypothetical protein